MSATELPFSGKILQVKEYSRIISGFYDRMNNKLIIKEYYFNLLQVVYNRFSFSFYGLVYSLPIKMNDK